MKSRRVMTARERKAMVEEIKRQLVAYDEAHADEHEAIILWVLHIAFGFGKTRLRAFHDAYTTCLDELIENEKTADGTDIWAFSNKLKEYGVDLGEWRNEESDS